MTVNNLDRQLENVRQLNEITDDASKFFDVPYAMINLVTSDRVIFKSCTGLTAGDSLDRDGSFCSAASEQESPLVITDATQHPSFKNNPLVIGSLNIRSYAGKSLHAPDGKRIGTLCLLDTVPRKYTKKQLSSLMKRAELASAALHSVLANA